MTLFATALSVTAHLLVSQPAVFSGCLPGQRDNQVAAVSSVAGLPGDAFDAIQNTTIVVRCSGAAKRH